MSNAEKAMLSRVREILYDVPRDGDIDPANVARQADIDVMAAVGYLRLLEEEGEGRFVVRVLGRDGDEVERFPNVRSIPPQVPNKHGDLITVRPENIDITFEPEWHVTHLGSSVGFPMPQMPSPEPAGGAMENNEPWRG